MTNAQNQKTRLIKMCRDNNRRIDTQCRACQCFLVVGDIEHCTLAENMDSTEACHVPAELEMEVNE